MPSRWPNCFCLVTYAPRGYNPDIMTTEGIQRLRLTIRGAVQGVGFRPFIYRLASELTLSGWVCNTSGGLIIEAEGPAGRLQDFLLRISREQPPQARLYSLEPSILDPAGYRGFEIRESQSGEITAWISPDIATCQDCRRELLDINNRRYRYPFINCTHCGPRYSIIERMPYDRANTTMAKFRMCPACQGEYDDPNDRRFHAQPNACPVCGPQLELWDGEGRLLSARDEALRQAVDLVRQGRIIALKGLGGFHLVCDATAPLAVQELRRRKRRAGKPLAVMFPDLECVKKSCRILPLEERLLTAPEAPIVLLHKLDSLSMADEVAAGNPCLGVMLPYTPVHLLFLQDLGRPLVATSGNLSEETICIDEKEALTRLQGIADFFLVHNRPILRAIDDSVARVLLNTEQVIRRARGYAPLPVVLKNNIPDSLAVGGHLKNCVAVGKGKDVFLSQHIGDLETEQALSAFEKVSYDLQALYQISPQRVACDLHPHYHSTGYAQSLGKPLTRVQHHVAHIYSCIAENDIPLPVLGVSWDGSGYGMDGTVWGGEFIQVTSTQVKRCATFLPFPLPGGEKAVLEPRRALLGATFACLQEKSWEEIRQLSGLGFSLEELSMIRQMLVKKINSPMTSSVGRLFDAVAALVGLRSLNSFEGEAAMALEFALPAKSVSESYTFQFSKIGEDGLYFIQAPAWNEVIDDMRNHTPIPMISAKFHNMLAEIIVALVRACGEQRVALTGGCFQNRYLTERSVELLRREKIAVYWHQRVPTNDGGLALGQILALNRDCT